MYRAECTRRLYCRFDSRFGLHTLLAAADAPEIVLAVVRRVSTSTGPVQARRVAAAAALME